MSSFAYLNDELVWARDIAKLTPKELKAIKERFRDRPGEGSTKIKFMPVDVLKRRAHFSYLPNESGNGESLTHLLFKLAFRDATNFETNAQWDGWPLGKLTVSKGICEYPLWCHGRRPRALRIDVVLQVERPTMLMERWGKRLGIEVHRSNEVEEDKCRELREARIPCLEITVPTTLEIEDTHELTDDDITAHIGKCRSYIQSTRLEAKTLSSEHSVAYLESVLPVF